VWAGSHTYTSAYRLGLKSASTTLSNHLKGEDQAPKLFNLYSCDPSCLDFGHFYGLANGQWLIAIPKFGRKLICLFSQTFYKSRVTAKQMLFFGNYSGLFFSIDSYLKTKKLTPSPSFRKIALIFSVV
jgi:hypothetical protein